MKAFINAKLVYPDYIQDGALLVENGKILASGSIIPPASAEIIDVAGAYLGPGLIDIHCHGYVGTIDEPNYDVYDTPAETAMAHLRHGTTSITPSAAYNQPKEKWLRCFQNCQKAIDSGNTPIIGIHFEGPFTNPKYGSNSEKAWPFSKELCEEIFGAAGKNVLHCTYAPEMPWGTEFGEFLQERGVIADLGHTELSPDDAKRAIHAGARIVTHLYDAMGYWRGKDSITETGTIQESVADIVLSMPNLYYELICDSRGIHVKPANVRLALRTAGEDSLILITDCADFRLYNPADFPAEDLRSAADLRINDRGQLSGSCQSLSNVCRTFMQFTNSDVRVAFKCASTNPAKALKMDEQIGSIDTGRDANLLIVDENFNVKEVYFHGEKVQTN